MHSSMRRLRLRLMDRRFICPNCAVKWFIPADQPEAADLTHCAACGERLVPFMGTPPDCIAGHEEAPVQPAPPPSSRIAS
jgi:hypothetical protein